MASAAASTVTAADLDLLVGRDFERLLEAGAGTLTEGAGFEVEVGGIKG